MKLYCEGNNYKLYNGDCIETMDYLIEKNIKVDKIITSPPYNIIRPNSVDRGYDLYKDGQTNDEYSEWTISIFNRYDKLLNENGCIAYNMSYGTENTENMILTISNILKNTNFTIADILIWKKDSATPNNVSKNKMTRICEFVYIFCRRNEFNTFYANKRKIGERENTKQPIYENIFNFFKAPNNNESTDLNKATFSIEFVQNILDRYVKKDDIVLDNFSGTGTTIVACIQKNIKCIGIELSENQCKHTKDRLSKGVQIDLLGMLGDKE